MRNETMKMTRLLTLILAPCLFVLINTQPAMAQSASATLSGTVIDTNGAVVPGALVTLTDTARGFERSVTTNSDGSFSIPLLQPGNYTLLVAREGFASAQVGNVILNVNDTRAIRVELKISPVKGEVVVTPDASLVDQSPAVGTTVDRTFVGNLPLSGRSFQSLILLTPGVVQTVANNGNPGQFSVNGQRSNANYFTVDGVSANTGIDPIAGVGGIQSQSQQLAGSVPSLTALGTTASLISVDALEEFKIQTSTYSAEYGRQPGGQVQLLSRSGKNQFRGNIFEYVRNEAFDANNWFVNSRPLTAQQVADGVTKQPRTPLRHNQFGGTFSGPVMFPSFGEGGKDFWSGRNRTFFFFSYEGARSLLPQFTDSFVPSLRLRDLAPEPIRAILNAFPLPTGPELYVNDQPMGASPFRASSSNPKNVDATGIRIDHTINSRITVFGRLQDASSESLTQTLARLAGSRNRARTLTIGSVASISSNVSNDLRVNYATNRGQYNFSLTDFGGAIPIDMSAIVAYNGAGVKQGAVSFLLGPEDASDFREVGLVLGDSSDSRQRQVNIVDSLTVISGNHHLKFGVDYRRLAPIYAPVNYIQDAFFVLEPGILANAPFVSISAQQGARPIFTNFSAYVDDSWRYSKRLTLNFGLRWELNPAPREANGIMPVLVNGANDLPTATLASESRPLYRTDYTAFAPRLGAAYLLHDSKGRSTVLRGGVGIFYDLGSGQSLNGFSTYPFMAQMFYDGGSVSLPLTPEQAVPPTFPPVQLPITDTLYSIDPNLRLPRTYQWNVSIGQELGSDQSFLASYVGSNGTDLLTTQVINRRSPILSARPNPDFGDIIQTSNGPSSSYHAMQLQFQRRLSKGFQSLVNYTWSHAIDEVSDEVNQGTLVRGSADFDVRHNFTAAVTYEIPKVSAGPILSFLLRNWSLNSLLIAQTGQPLDLRAGSLVYDDGTQVTVRPDLVPGAPLWREDSQAPGGQRINPAAFERPPTNESGVFLRQGTLGRNVVRLPGLYQINMSLVRQFDFGEKIKLQLRADLFNVLNHPQFGLYDNSIGSSSFGRALTTRNTFISGIDSLYELGGPRSTQFSLRLSF